MVRHIDQPSDVILHNRRETRAFHGGLGDAAVQLRSHVDGIIAFVNGTSQKTKELTSGLEDGLDLTDGDEPGVFPGELTEGTDQALIWPLGTLLGEGRLAMSVSDWNKEACNLLGEELRHA